MTYGITENGVTNELVIGLLVEFSEARDSPTLT